MWYDRTVCYVHWNNRSSCAVCERNAEEAVTTTPEDASYSSADDDFVEKIPAPLVCDEEALDQILLPPSIKEEEIITEDLHKVSSPLLLLDLLPNEISACCKYYLNLLSYNCIVPAINLCSFIYTLVINTSRTSTVSLPTPPNSENVEEVAASSTDDSQAEVILSSSIIDEYIGGTLKNDEPIGHISEEEEEEQRVDDTKASKNDKKRRRKRKVSTPLESICCRGVYGGTGNC